ncbi:hypothetical protein KH388_09980 [Serratia rubidaea]|nr:hypothetical protein [Serratia rubidaea]
MMLLDMNMMSGHLVKPDRMERADIAAPRRTSVCVKIFMLFLQSIKSPWGVAMGIVGDRFPDAVVVGMRSMITRFACKITIGCIDRFFDFDRSNRSGCIDECAAGKKKPGHGAGSIR